MSRAKSTGAALIETTIDVRFKMSALWVSVMLCYIYGDYFELYQPGKLQGMLAGRMGPLGPATQWVLLGTSLMMAIPAVMVFLSLALRPGVNRWANIILGVIYTLIMIVTMPGAWAFYLFLGIIEVALTGLIVWYAWTWPRYESSAAARGAVA